MEIQHINSSVEYNISIRTEEELKRTLNNIRQEITSQNPPIELINLLNRVERLINQGNLLLAERQLKEAEKIAKDNSLLSNISEGIKPTSSNPGIPKSEKINPTNFNYSKEVQEESKLIIPTPTVVKKTYQDVSNDLGASLQAPTVLNEYEARVKIPAHEKGHLIRAIAKALVHRREINYAYFKLNWAPVYNGYRGFIITGGVARISIGGPIVDLKV